MTHRYEPVPNGDMDDAGRELEAAFDNPDDDDDSVHETTRLTSSVPDSPTVRSNPGGYDFENLSYDYDRPPAGSPPVVPGNSNGLVPSFDTVSRPVDAHHRPGWFRRVAAAILPSRLSPESRGPVGGGNQNDGVFANVTAKPAVPTVIQNGDDSTYIVPEDARSEAPPSYAVAQLDSVPPYWETTVHAPFIPGEPGEVIVDSLPTGTFFSFLWNMLVSVSFQFVGFLLTYLLHTSHSARLGSRAGLGITLIQYGFALRSRLDHSDPEDIWHANWTDTQLHPTFPTAAEGNDNGTSATPTFFGDPDQASVMIADATTDWLSFFLMTIGWFVLLTSVLGFWRIKRWERGIMQSHEGGANNDNPSSDPQVRSQFQLMFGLNGSSRDLFRTGLGLRTSRDAAEAAAEAAVRRAEEGDALDARETDAMLPPDSTREQRAAFHRAIEDERRLQDELRNAGLL